VVRTTGADRTAATSLLLDTVSAFYGNRVEIRNWFLHQVMPGAERLRDALRPDVAPLVEDAAAVALAAARLEQMRRLTAEYGADFILTIPPLLSSQGLSVLERGAAQAGTRLWIPLGPGTLPPSSFSDGSHLNAAGASAFTPALARALRAELPAGTVGRLER
jgi:hypothetical protein